MQGVILPGQERVEIKEFERTSTTVVNAYLAPGVRRYLEALGERLRGIGVTAPLRVMQSNGGLTTAAAAAARPVGIIESGPAADELPALVHTDAHGRQLSGRDRYVLTFPPGGLPPVHGF